MRKQPDVASRVEVIAPHSIELLRRPGPGAVILLLHGYQLRGSYLYERLLDRLPSDADVVAPSGPFPIPEKKADGSYRVGHSWYFYDGSHDEYYVNMAPACGVLSALIKQLGLEERPKKIVGFSQGGYLAPFIAQDLKNVTQVIGVAARYLDDELPTRLPFRLDCVHGGKDEVVPPADSRASHEKLVARGNAGKFVLLPEEEHRMSSAMAAEIVKLLEEL